MLRYLYNVVERYLATQSSYIIPEQKCLLSDKNQFVDKIKFCLSPTLFRQINVM